MIRSFLSRLFRGKKPARPVYLVGGADAIRADLMRPLDGVLEANLNWNDNHEVVDGCIVLERPLPPAFWSAIKRMTIQWPGTSYALNIHNIRWDARVMMDREGGAVNEIYFQGEKR